MRAMVRVATAEWGYQVDFTNVELMDAADGPWEPMVEGFGEVFLAPDFSVIEAAIGP